jgi:hypothetical protein
MPYMDYVEHYRGEVGPVCAHDKSDTNAISIKSEDEVKPIST